VLSSAINNNLTREDLPDYIIILSDMEFDSPEVYGRNTNFESIKIKFKACGLEMPTLVFWNLNGRI
jgi:hypothetical protein